MAQHVKNLPAMQETQETKVDPWVGKIPWSRKWQPSLVFLHEKSHGKRSLVAIVQEVAKSQTGLSYKEQVNYMLPSPVLFLFKLRKNPTQKSLRRQNKQQEKICLMPNKTRKLKEICRYIFGYT